MGFNDNFSSDNNKEDVAKESVHVRVDKELYDNLEKLRVKKTSKIVLNRSDIYNDTLFYGYAIQKIKDELGEKEFELFWEKLHKFNLHKVDITKII